MLVQFQRGNFTPANTRRFYSDWGGKKVACCRPSLTPLSLYYLFSSFPLFPPLFILLVYLTSPFLLPPSPPPRSSLSITPLFPSSSTPLPFSLNIFPQSLQHLSLQPLPSIQSHSFTTPPSLYNNSLSLPLASPLSTTPQAPSTPSPLLPPPCLQSVSKLSLHLPGFTE